MVGSEQHQDSYFSRLHLVGIATLVVLTVGFSLTAWALRPSSGGFSSVPSDLQLTISKAPIPLKFTETISPASGGGAVLTVEGMPLLTDSIPGRDGTPIEPFTLVAFNLGDGRLCTRSALPNSEVGGPVHLEPQHISRSRRDEILPPMPGWKETPIVGRGYFYVRLCWPSDGPVAINGAYLNARFPAVAVSVAKEAPKVGLQLNVTSLDNTADYAVQSLQQPLTVTQGSWMWASAPLVFTNPQPLTFTAVNTSETQHDSYKAFLSGILFGVAGGALVSLIMELASPFRSRQERRQPEPGG